METLLSGIGRRWCGITRLAACAVHAGELLRRAAPRVTQVQTGQTRHGNHVHDFAGDVFVHSLHSVCTYALCLILCPHRATTSLVEPAEVSADNCIGCAASAPENSWFPP